jgi:hypothetical protein
MTLDQAEAAMRLSRKDATIENFQTLPLSVARLLSSPSVPKEAVESAVKRATAGEKVTVAETKAAIKAAKPKKPVHAGAGDAVAPEASAKARKGVYAKAEANGGSPAKHIDLTIERGAAEPQYVDVKIDRLSAFKTACDRNLPEMTSADLAEARLYFELKCKQAAEMPRDEEAKKKHTASEGGSVH